jgi:ATP-dependent Clp protease ATP-binding subunit ClpC
MNRTNRRSPWIVLCARLTLAAFATSLSGPAAWAQAVSRVAPAAAPAALAGTIGASLSAPSILATSPLAPAPALSAAPLSAAALSAAPLAAPALFAAPRAAVPAAAPSAAPTAAAALKSVGSRSAAMSSPDVTAADARALSERTFDAAAARPGDSDSVPGSFSAGAPALSRGSSWAAASDGPDLPSGRDGASSPSNHELRAIANTLDAHLNRYSRGGQLMTKEELLERANVFGGASHGAAVLDLLASDGRLLRLSGDRYVYSDLRDRFDATYGDEVADRAGALAHEAVKKMNASTKLPDHARAVADLASALEALKIGARGIAGLGSAVIEVDLLLKNSAYELLRDVLREYEAVLSEKVKTDPSLAPQLENAREMKGAAMTAHVGADGKLPVFDETMQDQLEDLVGSLKPSQRVSNQEKAKAVARGLDVLYTMIAAKGGNASGLAASEGSAEKPQAPQLLLAPPAGDSKPKTDFKELDKSSYENLYKFGVDITQKAAVGKMRPMIGRKAELRQMVKTLLRVEKNNPLVIGEKGVGKTAIINGLAQMIVAGEIPELRGKNIVKIDLTKVVAGTKYRGEFEERMQAVIDEAKKSNGQVLLFIDEIHMIVGAGGASGSADASQILKESLSDGSLSLIGATTMDEFRKIEKDGALMRRFNPVKLLPPTKDEAEAILEGVKPVYEKKHGVTIALETVKAAVALAARYVTDRHLPDSALDLMDDASAEVELKASEAVAAGKENPTKAVTAEDIAREISMRTGIPAGKLNEDKKSTLKKLPAEMKGQVIGQDEAVEAVAEAVQQGETGYRDPKQPIASFVFLGPTGVGKTELARALAKIKFGSEKNMLRLDMSEYQEKHSVSRLISAPPGYVGHDEGGQLTESIRRNPYQVVLLDEIEKAHADVFDVLLQVLEDGRLTDGQGRTVDFSNTIIIMTSNIGGSLAAAGEDGKTPDGFRDGGDGFLYKQEGIGFGAKTIKIPKGAQAPTPERTKKYIAAFKEKYRPEFVNRVGEDRVIVFNEIAEKSKLGLILDLRLKALESQLKDKGLTVALTDAAREAVLDKALSQSQYGARPIKQIVDREINRALKDAELDGRISDGDAVIVDWDAAAGRYRADKAP